jgi:hypothetical protein
MRACALIVTRRPSHNDNRRLPETNLYRYMTQMAGIVNQSPFDQRQRQHDDSYERDRDASLRYAPLTRWDSPGEIPPAAACEQRYSRAPVR